MTPKFHTLTIADIRKETEDTVSIAFTIPEALKSEYKYLSGQYLTLKAMINGEDVRRSYSLCSAPFENEWRIAVKQIENGKFSTFANNDLNIGDQLEVMTPTGNFKIETNPTIKKTYALFAAGSGITPVISMAKSILKDETESDVSIVYGNKGFNSIIFREELEALKNQYMNRLRLVHILSRESLGNDIQKGRIDEQKTLDIYDAFFKNAVIDGAYICGPESMIHGVKDGLSAKGVEMKNIHFELFTSPSAKKESTALPTNSPWAPGTRRPEWPVPSPGWIWWASAAKTPCTAFWILARPSTP